MKNGAACIVIVIFLGLAFTSTPRASLVGELPGNPILQSYKGNTLYVGGSGPGNYSKIQDAIDNATNGDLIFVYDDSSPYYENIIIDKSITLIGENRSTTIIDARETGGNVVTINVDGVILTGFSILNCGNNPTSFIGIYIASNNNKILGDIISCITHFGEVAISLDHSSNNVISGNIISNHHGGIEVVSSSSNIISKNLLMNNFREAILLRSSNDNNISENIIVNNTCGIDVGYSTNNNINGNEISYNTYGIEISYSIKNIIIKNNFIKNIVFNAYNIFTTKPFWRNIWDANYWNRARVFPQFIFGYIKTSKGNIIPWVNVDWRPAHKPYDVPIRDEK